MLRISLMVGCLDVVWWWYLSKQCSLFLLAAEGRIVVPFKTIPHTCMCKKAYKTQNPLL